MTVPDIEPLAAGELEQRLFRFGLIVVPVLTAMVVGVCGLDLDNVLSLLVITLSLLLVRGTGAELPFLLMAAELLVLAVYAAFFLKAAMLQLPNYYASVDTTVGTLWLSVYPLYAAVGVIAASYLLRGRQAAARLRAPQLPLVILVPMWCLAIAIGLADLEFEDIVGIAVMRNFIPLLTVVVALRARSRLARAAVLAVSLGVAALTTSRNLFGEYLQFYILTYVLYVRVAPRRLLVRLGAVVVLGCAAYYGITILKYGGFQQEQLYMRTTVIEAHAAMRIKQAVDEGFALGARESQEMARYWWSLVPFTGKPINSGEFTFFLARTGLTRDENIPYLPPPAQAELYLTGGLVGEAIGGCLHGLLLGWAWLTARRLRDSPLQCAMLLLMTAMLIGVGGGPDLYGRLEGVKWALYTGLSLWLVASLFSRGLIIAKSSAGPG